MAVKWRQSKNKSISARAGTSKTTCIEHAVKRLFGMYDFKFPYTEQQLAILEEVQDFDGHGPPIVMSFARSIVDELKMRLKKVNVRVSGFHSYGNYLMKRRGWAKDFSEWKVSNTFTKCAGHKQDSWRTLYPQMRFGVERMVDLARYFLVKQMDPQMFLNLMDIYEVDFGVAPEELVLEYTNYVLTDVLNNKSTVDHTDMVYLPMMYDLVNRQFGLVIVDEWQDTNFAQQEMARRLGDLLGLFGDNFQAIYGFAGADWQAYDRLKATMERSVEGLCQLPLTISFRCSKAVIAEAQKVVPDIQAWEASPDGSVTTKITGACKGTDFADSTVLCRTNAPLVSCAMQMAAEGHKVHVVGKDVKGELLRLLKQFGGSTIGQMMTNARRWLEAAKERKSKGMIGKEDYYRCLLRIVKQCSTINAVEETIRNMFLDDDDQDRVDSTKLMSIHKAKGLEWEKVTLLGVDNIPHPWSTSKLALDQEKNLLYVAITRAKVDLLLTEGLT